MAGTGVENWSDTHSGAAYRDYDPTRTYLQYNRTYPGYGSDIAVKGEADARLQSMGAFVDMPVDSTYSGYAGIGTLFNGRLHVGKRDVAYYPEPVDLRLNLRLSGSLTSDPLTKAPYTYPGNNEGMMLAAYLVYEADAPLEPLPGSSLFTTLNDVEFDVGLMNDIQPLATFFAEARVSRWAADYDRETFTYDWHWWARSDRNDISARNNGFTLDGPLSTDSFEMYFDTSNVMLDFTATSDSDLWITGILLTDARVQEATGITLDFLNGFSASISSLTPGVSVDYSANVSAVPVPAGVWLFGSGLFFLFGFVKRRA